MENEPTNPRINPIVLAVIAVLALIGLACLVIWIVQVLVNVVIAPYTNDLFSFREAFALTALVVMVSGLVGTAAGSRGK